MDTKCVYLYQYKTLIKVLHNKIYYTTFAAVLNITI